MSLTEYRYMDRGPTSSADYNNRVRETIDNLLSIQGRISMAEADIRAATILSSLEQQSMSGAFELLGAELEQLREENEIGKKIVGLYSDKVSRTMSGDPAEAEDETTPISSPLSWEKDSGLVVLPYTNRLSKINYSTESSVIIDPDTKVAYTHSDEEQSLTANDPYNAVNGKDQTAFIVRSSQSSGTKTLVYYISIPSESANGSMVNYLEILPAPINHCKLRSITYSDELGAKLDETTLWKNFFFYEETSSSGICDQRFKVPQNSISNENAQNNCGFRRYYFGERRISAIRIELQTDSDINIGEGPERVIGIRRIDVGHVSWGSTGKIVFNVSIAAPARRINSVTPRLLNRGSSPDKIDGIGIYEPTIKVYINIGTEVSPIWEEYSLGDDVGAGNEVEQFKVELQLDLSSNNNTPVVSGFNIGYSIT